MITGKLAGICQTYRLDLRAAILLGVGLCMGWGPGPAVAAGSQAELPDSTYTTPRSALPPPDAEATAESARVDSVTSEVGAANVPGQVGLTTEELLQPTISPTAAVLMTPVFPGWGQLYARNSWRAALAYGVEMFYLSHMLMNDLKADRTQAFSETLPEGSPQRDGYAAQAEEFRERVRDFGWWAFAGMLIIALDAYVGAHLFQFDDDAIPVPNKWPEDTDQPTQTAWGMALEPTQVVLQWRLSF